MNQKELIIDDWANDVIDPLPIVVYIVEIGIIERITYTTGKQWINRHPAISILFYDLYKALDFIKLLKNKIVGKRYMFMYQWFEDDTKDYLHRSYGSLAYKDSRY